MRHFCASSFPILVLAALGGCKQDPVDIPNVDGVHGIWRKMFAPYGVYPLFPVRTNVQPGDVALLCKKHLSKDVTPAVAAGAATSIDEPTELEWVKLFSLIGTDKLLEDYAKTRMAYNSYSVTAVPPASSPMGPASAASGAGSPYRTQEVGSSVGFASFPSVLSYTQKRSDFGVGTVLGVAAIGAGTSNASQGYYTLEIPSAEFVELPFDALIIAAQRTLAAVKDGKSEYGQAVKLIGEAMLGSNCVADSLSVVGTTFYTRHLTVSMGSSYADAISARVAYQLPTDSTRDAVYRAIGSYATGASAPAAPGSSPLPANDSARFAQMMIDLDKVYKTADDNSKLGFTGVKVGFAKGGGSGVSMDYTYEKPVAFGLRLYSIRFDPGVPDLKVVLGGSRSVGGAGNANWKAHVPFGGLVEVDPASAAASSPK